MGSGDYCVRKTGTGDFFYPEDQHDCELTIRNPILGPVTCTVGGMENWVAQHTSTCDLLMDSLGLVDDFECTKAP